MSDILDKLRKLKVDLADLEIEINVNQMAGKAMCGIACHCPCHQPSPASEPKEQCKHDQPEGCLCKPEREKCDWCEKEPMSTTSDTIEERIKHMVMAYEESLRELVELAKEGWKCRYDYGVTAPHHHGLPLSEAVEAKVEEIATTSGHKEVSLGGNATGNYWYLVQELHNLLELYRNKH